MKKKPVWLLFKLLELIMSTVCCCVHIKCATLVKDSHIFILCGTYGGGIVMGGITLMYMSFSDKITMTMEIINSGLMGTLYLITVYAHMRLGEGDPLLPFVRNVEEIDYDSLACCTGNAVLALYTVAIYYMHLLLALDVYVTHAPKRVAMLRERRMLGIHTKRSKRPIKLFFISKDVEEILSKYRWFQMLSRNLMDNRPSQQPSPNERRHHRRHVIV